MADNVLVRGNVPVSDRLVCILCRRLVGNRHRSFPIVVTDRRVRLRIAMIDHVVHVHRIETKHHDEIWAVRPSVSVVRILVVRIVQWLTRICADSPVVRLQAHRRVVRSPVALRPVDHISVILEPMLRAASVMV